MFARVAASSRTNAIQTVKLQNMCHMFADIAEQFPLL